MKVTKCRACGAEMVFIPTLTTKSMPCNAQEVLYKAVEGGKERIVLPNGSVVSGVLVNDASEATGMGTSHTLQRAQIRRGSGEGTSRMKSQQKKAKLNDCV